MVISLSFTLPDEVATINPPPSPLHSFCISMSKCDISIVPVPTLITGSDVQLSLICTTTVDYTLSARLSVTCSAFTSIVLVSCVCVPERRYSFLPSNDWYFSASSYADLMVMQAVLSAIAHVVSSPPSSELLI